MNLIDHCDVSNLQALIFKYFSLQTRVFASMLLIAFLLIGSVKAQPKIWVEDHTGINRESWPVSGGIPFSKGLVYETDHIGVEGIQTQSRVLSRWPDGSIKWALLDYQTDIKSNSRTSSGLVIGRSIQSPLKKEGNILSEDDESIFVDTGVLKFSVSRKKFNFINELWLDLNNNGQYENNEKIVNPSSGQSHFLDLQTNNPDRPGTPYSIRNLKNGTSRKVEHELPTVSGGPGWMRPEGGGEEIRKLASDGLYTAEVVEHGPLKTVIRLNGRIGSSYDDSEYTIWIHAYKGKSFLRVEHNFLFRGDPQTTNIRRVGLKLPVTLSKPKFSAEGIKEPVSLNKKENAYLFSTGPADVFHLEHMSFPLDWEVEAGGNTVKGIDKTEGWIDVASNKFGVTLAIKDMALKYPKELSFDAVDNSFVAWIWPDHGDQVLDLRASGWPDGMQGVSISHDIYYSFHKSEGTEQGETFAAQIDDRPQPFVDPEWYGYEGTRAAGMIMPHNDVEFPKTEAFLATGTTFIERSMTEFGWLGMLNYGDLLFMYRYHNDSSDLNLGTWGISTRDDDYDGWRRGNTMISYRMFMQYLRTGEYRYWKAANAHLEFVRDALIKHYSKDSSNFVGFGRRHSAYWGISPQDESDRRGGVAWDGYGTNWLGHYIHWNLTGDWRTYEVINDIRSAWNKWGNYDIDQIKGGAYVGLKLIGGIPGYEKAKVEANDFMNSAIDRTSKPGDSWRDNTWFFGYGLYLQEQRDSTVEKAILDWWNAGEHKLDIWGLYWHRDALGAVYWAAEGNDKVQADVYRELSTIGTTESLTGDRITAEKGLYDEYGVSGLFDADMTTLGNAVARYYWRAKDDIIQLQWDEPLGMAVMDHFRKSIIVPRKEENKEDDSESLTVEDTSDEITFKVRLDKPTEFELEVYNAAGESIWHTTPQKAEAGEFAVVWNYASSVIDKEENGSYYVSLIVGDKRKSIRRIVK